MTKYLNRPEEKKHVPASLPVGIPKPNLQNKLEFWYRVAIMYNPDQNFYYTKVIDKPHHHTSIEGEQNFVRWEPAVEYTV